MRNDFYTQMNIIPSETEIKISEWLTDRGIKYYQEVGFYDLVNPITGHNLRFDFYFPERNMIIEYDGKQHKTDYKIMFRDDVKNKFCRINHIKIIRLSNFYKLNSDLKKIFGDLATGNTNVCRCIQFSNKARLRKNLKKFRINKSRDRSYKGKG